MSHSDPGQSAVELLLAIRYGATDAIERHEASLAEMDESRLLTALSDDSSRLAFWIDLYNAAVLRQPGYDFAGWRARSRFFRRPVLTVAGRPLSLDTMEHGILRRSRPKMGLGFATSPLPSAFERRQRVAQPDPRVHFALNCAAASCPPIAAYRAEQLDQQLDLATRSYLREAVHRDDKGIVLPTVFLWFIGDFGGPPGVRRFLREHGVDGWGDRIRFASWDWTPAPDKWVADTVVPDR